MTNLVDLLTIYAEHNEISFAEALEWYKRGRIPKISLLEAYLEEEGIFGYTSALWSIFEALK